MLVSIARVERIHIGWVHTLELQALTLSILRDELIHVHVASTHAANQLVVRNLRVDLLGAKHVPALADTRDRDLAVLDTEHASKHLIDAVTFDCAILARSHSRNLHCFVDLVAHQIQFVVESVSFGLKFFNLLLALLYRFFDHLHLDVEVVQGLELLFIFLAVSAYRTSLSVEVKGQTAALVVKTAELLLLKVQHFYGVLLLLSLLLEVLLILGRDLDHLLDFSLVCADTQIEIVLLSLHHVKLCGLNLVDHDGRYSLAVWGEAL